MNYDLKYFKCLIKNKKTLIYTFCQMIELNRLTLFQGLIDPLAAPDSSSRTSYSSQYQMGSLNRTISTSPAVERYGGDQKRSRGGYKYRGRIGGSISKDIGGGGISREVEWGIRREVEGGIS